MTKKEHFNHILNLLKNANSTATELHQIKNFELSDVHNLSKLISNIQNEINEFKQQHGFNKFDEENLNFVVDKLTLAKNALMRYFN